MCPLYKVLGLKSSFAALKKIKHSAKILPPLQLSHLSSNTEEKPLTIFVLRLLALFASLLLPLVENALGLGCLLQARHEPLHVVEAVVQDLLTTTRAEHLCGDLQTALWRRQCMQNHLLYLS